MKDQTTPISSETIAEAANRLLETIYALPPTNEVLRKRAVDSIKKAKADALAYWSHQNTSAKLQSEQEETEEQRALRIVAPYIKNANTGRPELLGKKYNGELSMNVIMAAAKQILQMEAEQRVGMRSIEEGTQGGGEEKKQEATTATATPPNAAQQPSTSTTPPSDKKAEEKAQEAGEPYEFRNIGELFLDGNIAGSLFGETVLGSDGGETAIKELDKALMYIDSTTSAASIQRGDTSDKMAEYSICLIAWMLGIIESEDINIASATGLHTAPAGRPTAENARLTKRNLIEAIFARLRPDMEKKETHKRAAKRKTEADQTTIKEPTTEQ